MRKMTVKELGRVFHLRNYGHKRRIRKKNHHRALKYITRYGLTYKGTIEYYEVKNEQKGIS